nr:hypothetical protein [uncultured Cohaesibacter sp.]
MTFRDIRICRDLPGDEAAIERVIAGLILETCGRNVKGLEQ